MVTKPNVRSILRSAIWSLERSHNLPAHVRRAAYRIFKCQTPALGRHVHACENGHQHVRWNSCRHRSCPICAWPAKKRWLTKTEGRLLDCPHHHFVFTIATELHGLWLVNTPEVERLLFREATATLETLFAQRYRGARPGIIAVLHTWGRSMSLHPHLHMIVTRGGVDATGRWREPNRNLKAVLPAKVVSALFRGKLLASIRAALDAKRLSLPEGCDDAAMRRLIAAAYEKRWSVFIGHAGTRLQTIVNYLGRYVCGGPIGNGRILGLGQGLATFMHRDYRVQGADGRPVERPMALAQTEFLRRWMLHVPLPHSKTVRSYGLYAPAYTRPIPKLPRSRVYREPPDEAPSPSRGIMCCPDCGAPLHMVSLTRSEWKRGPPLGRIG